MKHLNLLFSLTALLAVILFCSGCASGPKVDPQITAAVAAANVNKVTYDKVFNAVPLGYSDIMNLVKCHVPSTSRWDISAVPRRYTISTIPSLLPLKPQELSPNC